MTSFFRNERTQSEIESMLDGWNMTAKCQRDMYLDTLPKQAGMILSAGALVIPCFHQPRPILEAKRSLHELNALASMWTVLENILIAAASEGIQGVTKIISTPEESAHVRNILLIPSDYEMPCYLALGYPAEDTPSLRQIGVDPQERIWIDRWSSPRE